MDKVKESAFLGAMIIISTVAVIITAAIVRILESSYYLQEMIF